MINQAILDGLNDDDVREIKALCDKVLKARDDDRKAKALEQARATLAAVGLTLKDLAGGIGEAVKRSGVQGRAFLPAPFQHGAHMASKGEETEMAG
jgi:hypothetical protein